MFGDLPFRDLSRKRETERWIWLSPGENIFSISFMLSRVPSFSLIPSHTKDHRSRGRHLFTLLLFLSLMRGFLSLSLSLSILLTYSTCAVTNRSHRLFSDPFVHVRSCLCYICNSFKGNRQESTGAAIWASEWSVCILWGAWPSSGREETICELNWKKKVDKLQKSRNWNIKLYIPESLWSRHTPKANFHLKVLIKH